MIRREKEFSELTFEELINFETSLKNEKSTYGASLKTLLNHNVLIAYKENGIIKGICFITPLKKIIPRLHIVVKEKYQGQGIGSKLLCRIFKVSQMYYHYIFIQVHKKNLKSLKIFKNNGAQEIGQVSNFIILFKSLDLIGDIIKFIFKYLLFFNIALKKIYGG